MDIIGQVKIADVLRKLYMGDLQRVAGYEFKPQKGACVRLPPNKGEALPRSTPEAEGIPSAVVERFYRALPRLPDVFVHSALVLRHGRVIAEGHFSPYTAEYPHMLYSLSKSVVSTAVGMAVDEGLLSLDEKLADLFPDKLAPHPLRSPRVGALTVRHLLTMEAGVRFNELGSVAEWDWVKGYLQSDFYFTPGEQFYYNSMNSYMLCAILRRKTGMGVVEYLTPRLFEPLGIDSHEWETCPLGTEKGGWGLYLRPEDLAKLGQLYLNGGRWTVRGEARQLLSEEWIREATVNQVASPSDRCPDGYGYQIWMCPMEGAYQFNGAFGQYVVVMPKEDMVLVITGGSQNLFPQGPLMELIGDTFCGQDALSSEPLARNMHALRSLAETLKELVFAGAVCPKRTGEPQEGGFLEALRAGFHRKGAAQTGTLPPASARRHGSSYTLERNPAGLFPFILQGVHANFTTGLERIAFAFEEDVCEISFTEGEERNTVRCGMDGRPRYGEVHYRGETYAVGSTAGWFTDEDDRDVLKLSISFVETPNTRLIKILFDGDDLLMRFDELPSVRAASQMMVNLVASAGGGPLERMLGETAGSDRVKRRIDRLTAPKVKGKRLVVPEETAEDSAGQSGQTAT